jgi:hypothetical protein
MSAIRVGSRVRSFDFPDRSDQHFIVGTVEAIAPGPGELASCNRYHVRLEYRVWDGKREEPDDEMVYPPVNGTPIVGGGFCKAVELYNRIDE